MAQIIGKGTAMILAGGRSSRFGTDKALAAWEGGRMIEAVLETLRGVFPRVLIVAKRPERFRFLKGPGVEIVRDQFRASHALGGLYSGLCRVRTPYAFVCACDMPLLVPGLIRLLWRERAGRAAVVPRFNGILQPLCGVYARRCRLPIRRLVRSGRFRMQGLLEQVSARVVGESGVRKADRNGLSFLDIDTRRDYRKAVTIFRNRLGANGKRL